MVGANRQLIAHPRRGVSRHRIAYLNDRQNRQLRRGSCRFRTPLSPGAEHSTLALLRKQLIAKSMNVQEK
jgi:hypothetical protein